MSYKSLGRAILERLRQRGAERVYAVLGTDHVTLMREFEAFNGLTLVTVPHEFAAASLALGDSLAGKLGVALVHSIPGSLNASGVLLNALTSRIPLIVLAGESPKSRGEFGRTLRVHWSVDLKFPELPVKRAFRLDDDNPLGQLERAIALALSEPQGPVLITFRRDLLAKPVQEDSRKDPYFPGASRKVIERANELLSRLSRVALITYRAGRRFEAFSALKDFAERNSAPVENPVGERLNYPSDGPFATLKVEDAEGYIVVEHEAPWIVEREGVKVWVDPDPLFSLIEHHDFPCDLCVQSVPEDFLPYLKLPKQDREWAFVKSEQLRKYREERKSLRCIAAKELSSWGEPIFNEYQLDRNCLVLRDFNTYFGDLAADHLGWAWGASIGFHFSTGKKTIAVTGDGSFYLSSPESVAYVARRAKNVLLIFDDARWGSVGREYERFYGEGTRTVDLERADFSGLFSSFKIPYFEVRGEDELLEALGKARGMERAAIRVLER
ncbi:MAG: thiamine pyrophosphate-binding protein [Thermoprotei archaeon]